MTSEILRARQRYQAARKQAWALACGCVGNADYSVTCWSRAAEEAYHAQWPADREKGGWDWPSVMASYYRQVDHLSVVIMSHDMLCGVGIANTNATAVYARIFEGNPDPKCPLKGYRISIFFEAVAAYGQALGKREMWCVPVNDGLAELYRDGYGFELVTGPKGVLYYKREI